jgi:hypothetical protein
MQKNEFTYLAMPKCINVKCTHSCIIDFDGETKLIYAKPESIGDSLVGMPFMRSKNDSLRAKTLVFTVERKKAGGEYSKTAADTGYFSAKRL